VCTFNQPTGKSPPDNKLARKDGLLLAEWQVHWAARGGHWAKGLQPTPPPAFRPPFADRKIVERSSLQGLADSHLPVASGRSFFFGSSGGGGRVV
jgi:hypothetical protein